VELISLDKTTTAVLMVGQEAQQERSQGKRRHRASA
jgi:hypothetical protein